MVSFNLRHTNIKIEECATSHYWAFEYSPKITHPAIIHITTYEIVWKIKVNVGKTDVIYTFKVVTQLLLSQFSLIRLKLGHSCLQKRRCTFFMHDYIQMIQFKITDTPSIANAILYESRPSFLFIINSFTNL